MHDTVLTARQRGTGLAAVIAATFGIGFFLGVQMPLIGLVLERWGVSGTLIGLNGAMPSLAVLLLGPFLAGIVRRVGSTAAMLGGLAIGAGAVLAMPLIPDLGVWFVLRFMLGFGMALPWLVGETWINTVAGDRIRARVLGLYSSSLFGGMALGPIALQVVDIGGLAPFALAAGALVLAAVPLIAARRLAPSLSQPPGLRFRHIVLAAPTVAGAAFMAGLGEMAFFFLLPVYGLRAGLAEAPALSLLTVLIVGAIVLQFPLGWLADRMSRRLLLGLMALLAAVLVPMLGPVVAQPWLAWPLLFVLGGLVLGYYTVGLALLGSRFRGGDLAIANAAFVMLYEAGASVGPGVAGAAMDVWPPHGYLACFSITGVAFAILALRRYREVP